MAKKTEEKKSQVVVIPEVKEVTKQFKIIGTAPFVQLAFSAKAQNEMAEKMTSVDKAKKKKGARDFDDDYKGALHKDASDGWNGIPATALKAAMISACRSAGMKMTVAKQLFFIKSEGVSTCDGVPLIKISGKPEKVIHHVRNATGVADLRVRAMYREWSALVSITYDEEVISLASIVNLLNRAGKFVGIGEGRPDSKMSCGMGWGTFRIE